MKLDDDESGPYAEAVRDVAKHYKLSKILTGKSEDWLNLIMVVAMIYAPRYMAIRARLAEEDLERRARFTPGRTNPPPPSSQAGQSSGPQPGPAPTAPQPPPQPQPAPVINGGRPPIPGMGQGQGGSMPIPPLQNLDAGIVAASLANGAEEAELLRRAQIKAMQEANRRH